MTSTSGARAVNHAACAARTVRRTRGARRAGLVVLDGATGLRAAVQEVFGDVPVQRCQWHKRENVVSYLPKPQQVVWRRKLQAAYAHASYADAKRALQRLERELRLRNDSAAASLAEGLDDTLTLHRLGIFPELGTRFTTTHLIESVMARVEARTRRVARWRSRDQQRRWGAASLHQLEAPFRCVKGVKPLPLLRRALRSSIPEVHAAA